MKDGVPGQVAIARLEQWKDTPALCYYDSITHESLGMTLLSPQDAEGIRTIPGYAMMKLTWEEREEAMAGGWEWDPTSLSEVSQEVPIPATP
jgi:hypothetical protein